MFQLIKVGVVGSLSLIALSLGNNYFNNKLIENQKAIVNINFKKSLQKTDPMELVNDNFKIQNNRFWFDKTKLSSQEQEYVVKSLHGLNNINQLGALHSQKNLIFKKLDECTCNSGIPIAYWWGYAFYITSNQCKKGLKDLEAGEPIAEVFKEIMGDIPYLGILIQLMVDVGLPYAEAVLNDDGGCGVVWDVSWTLLINWFHQQGEYCNS